MEQGYYVGRLHKLRSEPTADAELEFPETDQSEEETNTIRSTKTRRSRSFKNSVSEHFRRNNAAWIIGLLTILILLSFPAFWDIKGSIGRIEAVIEGIKKDMNKYETDINNIKEKNQNQDLKLQEQDDEINYLNRESDKSQSPTK
jgi:hypothetical protein